MKRIARLSILLGLLAALAAGMLAGASTAAIASPTGLHGFMLTATESATSSFHRTPSFAWTPVTGAMRYEIQLSTSDTFRDNGILYDASNLQTPVASPNLTLPWITGADHSLYARVRAFLANGQTTPWSDDYGFDVVAPSPPSALTSAPGLLRWSPVEGANAYEVWLKDAGKIEATDTNVLDEREYYAFHKSSGWIGSVHWRVRAVRWSEVNQKNGLPATSFGPWSPTYTATNPDPTPGPITLGNSMSNVVSNGSTSAPAHTLQAGFTWSGDEALDGTPYGFYRVEVFTDSQCVNRVLMGGVVASPAYATRLFGGLQLPMDSDQFATAASVFLIDLPPATDPLDATLTDGTIIPNEDRVAADPTTTVHQGPDLDILSSPGAPVDLWDVKWPASGYYWTVVPVALVTWPDGNHWQDMELPQDVCAAGRVARFGVSSAPSVTKHDTPYASGLSSRGKLVSASTTNVFYGEPIVNWTPVPGAGAFEVQWARKQYPFNARGKRLTWDTSYVLPLKPGTWYYRVRGIDFNLPTGAQQLAWSDPVKIVVAAPRFHIAH
jgi:hypothetical protein